METLQQLELLMEEIGPAVEIVNAVEQLDEGLWGVACLDDEIGVYVDFDDENGSLVIRAEHEPPSEDNRLTTYESLLQYNGLARDTGVRMALDAIDKVVLQEADVETRDLDLPRLQAELENFVAKALVWQALLRRGGVADGEPMPAEAAGVDALRV